MGANTFPILFITATDLAGAIAGSGLIKRLADELPGATFVVVANAEVAPLFAEVPALEKLIVVKSTEGRMAKFGLWRKVRGRRWSLIVDARDTGVSGYLSRDKRALPKASLLGPRHPVLDAAWMMGVEDDPPPPYLFTGPETDAWAQEYLGTGGPVVAMAPTGGWGGRIWPTERFAQVANQLFAPAGPLPDARLLIIGPADKGEAIELWRFAGIRQRAVGKPGELTLLQTYAVLKRCRLFIGNDNIWMHLAAAAGCPTLGLFGPSDEETARPWGEHARTVRGPRGFAAFRALDPALNQVISHMMDLPTLTVFDGAKDLLATTGKDHG